MCDICGCGQAEQPSRRSPGHQHDHSDDPPHDHPRPDRALAGHLHFGDNAAGVSVAGVATSQLLTLQRSLMARNDGYAGQVRALLGQRRATAINVLSSPGSGKTSLLVATLQRLATERDCLVIEGDQQTRNDADRIAAAGGVAVQINTGKGCHLDGHMILHALQRHAPPEQGLVLIENVGNLVCPAGFDLGERHKVVVLSVTEGEDKPLKYPDAFYHADLMVINKVDLLPYVDFDLDQCVCYARQINPALDIIALSATSGEGLPAWLNWLQARAEEVASPPG